jgi:dTDP-4-amino-4,6-dideoxygalactose transaminase
MNQPPSNTPVRFIENKRPNPKRIEELLSQSARDNHWANHGPVARQLEQALAETTGVGPGRAVIACSSGTAALNALAGVHAMKLGRPIRWAVCAFGFFSTVIGPFANARVIDCDDQCMLDLDALAKTPSDQYDGVCFTNSFGRRRDVTPYINFCREQNKPLIVDNALGLFGFDRSSDDTPDEIISLHHTKPWGFGEGGCIIVAKEDEALARSLINFGVGNEKRAAPYANNGKLSDVAAAYIIDRIEQAPAWSPANDRQRQRIDSLIKQAALPLTPLTPTAPPGSAQAIYFADHPVPLDSLANPHLVLHKYYRPPYEPWPPRATERYAHILNIPCHANLADVPEEAIVQVLEGIARPTS